MAAYAYHAAVLGYTDADVNKFFYKGLFAIGMDDWGMEDLFPAEVSMTVEKGPFIVISGHDLLDLKLGPSLPAFISPNVLSFLVENYNIAPISTAEEDLKKILG